MRFLADDPLPVTLALRRLGHDVLAASEVMPGAADTRVLEHAGVEGRILLTFDKDFGELAFRSRLPALGGIVLFRLSGQDPGADNARALAALSSRDDWVSRFAVVTQERIRMRPLPPAR